MIFNFRLEGQIKIQEKLEETKKQYTKQVVLEKLGADA